jgi:pimeloyl-ACP methyl ester carboxylesterase
MDRRTFVGSTLAVATSSFLVGPVLAEPMPKAKNVVLVHGLFADGSSWSEVIPRLQAAGLNVTSVQNPLTTLPEAVASAVNVLARQDGPTVLAGHSFSGMIVTDAGVHPNVSAVVYVAARAPDAGEDYTALAKTFPTPPATAGIVFDGDEGRLGEEAFLRDFAGDLPEAKAKAKAKVLCAVQWPFQKTLLTGKTTHAAWRSKPSWYAVSTEDRTINHDLERFMAKRIGGQDYRSESQPSIADLPPKGNLSTDPGGSRTDLGRRGASTNGVNVRFSNRPVGVKRYQTVHGSGVNVTRGLVLLYGIGASALPSWDSKTRWNNLLGGLAVGRSKRTRELTSSIVPRGTPFHHLVELGFPPTFV